MHRVPSLLALRASSAAFALLVLAALIACVDNPVAPGPARPAAPTAPRATVGSTPLTPTAMVTVGGSHSCALSVGGVVSCWGANDSGQTNVPKLLRTAQIDAGYTYTCAVQVDGTVWCWGDGGAGQPNAGLSGVVQVSAGLLHACALKSDRTVACWGSNGYGQTDVPLFLEDVVQVSAGSWHSCALKSNGTPVCWGFDGEGQATVPAKGLATAQVIAGGRHTCILTTFGTVSCWGMNNYGQATVPDDLTDVIQVSADQFQTCALKADRTLRCWGHEERIQAPSGRFNQVGAGVWESCAVSELGTVTCFGPNGIQTRPGLNLLLPQTIAFDFSLRPNPVQLRDFFTARATGGASGNPVRVTSLTPDVCSVTPMTGSFRVDALAAGVCELEANQDGNASYAPAPPVRERFDVTRIPQVVRIMSTPPEPAIVGASYTVVVEASRQVHPIVVSSLTPATCTMSGTVARFVGVGTCTIAADMAGDEEYAPASRHTQSFPIIYDFGSGTGGGFTGPVSSTSFNSARAGQAVPVKFSLGGDLGLLILASGYPKSVTIACPGGNDPVNVVPETTTAGGSGGLTYDAATALYTYLWRTDRAWSGSCREFVLRLADGTEHTARFQFR